MSLIKCKVQSAKCKVLRNHDFGFSLIEMLIVLTIIGVVAVIASVFLITSLGGVSRAEVTKEVRQNGNFALSVMEGLILSSKKVSCVDPANPLNPPDNKNIWVTDLGGNIARFVCDDAVNYKISSMSSATVDLTGDNVAVSSCNFICTSVAGNPTKVAIDFSVSQSRSTQRPNERSTMRFQTEVMTKNY